MDVIAKIQAAKQAGETQRQGKIQPTISVDLNNQPITCKGDAGLPGLARSAQDKTPKSKDPPATGADGTRDPATFTDKGTSKPPATTAKELEPKPSAPSTPNPPLPSNEIAANESIVLTLQQLQQEIDAGQANGGSTTQYEWNKGDVNNTEEEGEPVLEDAIKLVMPAEESRKKNLARMEDHIVPTDSSPDAFLDAMLEKVFSCPAQGLEESDDAYKARRRAYAEHGHIGAHMFRTMGTTLSAVYFDLQTGQRLIPVSDDYTHKESFSLKCDRHMSRFIAYVSGTSNLNDKPASAALGEGDPEADSDTQTAMDKYQSPSETQMEDIELMASAFDVKDGSISKTSRLEINYQSLQDIQYVDLKADGMDEDEQKLVDALPAPIVDYMIEHLEMDEHPVLIWIKYDMEYAAEYRLRPITRHWTTPRWAQTWADAALTGSLTMVVDGSDILVEQLWVMESLLKRHQAYGSPLNQFHVPNLKRRVYDPRYVTINIDKPEKFSYQPRLFFNSLEEYFTIQAVSNLSNRKNDETRAQSWDDHIFKLKLGEVANSEGRSYVGWFELPDDLIRPKPGIFMEVTFESQWRVEENAKVKKEKWMARVAETSPGPQHMVPITISRLWYGKTQEFSKEQVNTIPTTKLTDLNIVSGINRSNGNRVRIHIDAQLKVSNAQLRCIEDLNHGAEGRPELTDFNHNMLVAFVGSKLHELKPVNIFVELRKEFGSDIHSLMSLNAGQERAIKNMEFAPGGINIIQGPPGTGKTKTIVEICKVFMMSEINRLILVVTSSNSAVNTLANKLDAALNDLRQAGKLKREGYVTRVYTPTAEKSLLDVEANLRGKRDLSKKRPANVQGDVDYATLDVATAAFTKHYLEENKAFHKGKYAAVRDERVQTPELAVAVKMLEVIGHYKTKDTFPDPARFADLRTSIRQYHTGEIENESEFSAQMEAAMDFTIQGAKVIITTTNFAGLPRITEPLEKVLYLIISDESPREKEASLVSLFSTRAPVRGTVLLGDWLQLKPVITMDDSINVFAKQEAVSLMPRLVQLGMPYSELTEQHRMNEKLCAMANTLTYDNKLTTHPGSEYHNQPKSIMFGKWAAKYLKKMTAKLLFNITGNGQNSSIHGYSRYNDTVVIVCISIAKQLLEAHPLSTIAMLTAYSAQRDRLMLAARNLHSKEPQLFERNPDRLFALTVDAVQGEEYDYVVDSILTVADSIGFQKDAHRGNVATTRARHGYVLVADVRSVERSGKRNLYFVGRLINHLKHGFMVTLPIPDNITCAYYKPSQSKEIRG